MTRRHALRLHQIVLAVLLLAPAIASAQSRGRFGGGGAEGPAVDGLGFELTVGLDIPSPSGVDVGPRFTAGLMYGLSDMTPALRADLGVYASFAYHNADFGSLWDFDVIPELRLVGAVTPRLALFGDLGVGIAVLRASNGFGGTATDTVAAFELAPGLSYALSPMLNLLAEIRFTFFTGGDGTYIALPTIGFQWH
jgi:opacity protein-like surface antigen